jgi:hypothetical protein
LPFWKTDSFGWLHIMALSLKMADNKESHVLRDEVKSNSLLNAILPIDVILETQNTMMATHFSKSPYWQSLLIIGQSQVQRNGLLFQASFKLPVVCCSHLQNIFLLGCTYSCIFG